MTTSDPYELTVTYEVVEDLHSGTGTGTLSIDSLQARDYRGIPCVPRTHLKGLLRISASRLEKAGAISHGRVLDLLGDQTGQKGRLSVPTLRSKTPLETILWSETARLEGSRIPAEDSLRVIEFIPAGTLLSGIFRLRGTCDEALKKDIETIIKRIHVLGSERNRGSGLVKIIDGFQWSRPETRELTDSKGARKIRLLLRNLEAITIPQTGHAGNIIRSESHIPGRVLFGALAFLDIEKNGQSKLFGADISIGNAYPLPCVESPEDCVKECDVLPMPLNIYRHKDSSTVDDPRWPVWCPRQNTAKQKKPEYYDSLLPPDELPDSAGKRPKGHVYLYRRSPQDDWQAFTARLTIAMRNRRRLPEELQSKDETELFSVQQIPAEQWFLSEITGTTEALEDFVASFSTLLVGGDWLTIGRGGAPLRIEQVFFCKDDPHPLSLGTSNQAGDDGHWQITLTSDLIARAPNTGFYCSLSETVLAELLDMDHVEEPGRRDSNRENPRPQQGSDYESHGAFNAASGLPRPPVTVIRRGSVLRLPKHRSEKLRSRLAEMNGEGLGERCHEGYGRFVLDFYPDPASIVPFSVQTNPKADPRTEKSQRELVLKIVDDQYGMKPETLKSKDVYGLIADLPALSREPGLKAVRAWLKTVKKGLQLKRTQFSITRKAFPNQRLIDYRSACLIGLKYLADRLRRDGR